MPKNCLKCIFVVFENVKNLTVKKNLKLGKLGSVFICTLKTFSRIFRNRTGRGRATQKLFFFWPDNGNNHCFMCYIQQRDQERGGGPLMRGRGRGRGGPPGFGRGGGGGRGGFMGRGGGMGPPGAGGQYGAGPNAPPGGPGGMNDDTIEHPVPAGKCGIVIGRGKRDLDLILRFRLVDFIMHTFH